LEFLDKVRLDIKYSRPRGTFEYGATDLTRGRFCEEELPEDKDNKHDPVVEADRVDREIDVQRVRTFPSWLLSNGNFR
jgi:hypothetical protein